MIAKCLYFVIAMQTLTLTLGKLSMTTNCSVKGRPCTISCSIPAFTNLASWSRDGESMTSCPESINTTFFCTETSTKMYSFSADRLGIYAGIFSLSPTENGARWGCTHGEDTPVFISISIPKRDQIYKSGLSGGSIAGIVIGILIPVIFGIIIIVIVLRKKW